jgi:dTDP-4-dehydrorhamnose reductase
VILITGAGGQLGLDLLDAFAHHEVVGLDRAALDVTNEAAVVAAVRDLAPRAVINAAAWTDVDACERQPDRAHAVNALGPWYLARACSLVDATLVTVSTDHVFDGRVPPGGRSRGWSEFDAPAPCNVYGRSKAAGEQLVREALPRHHIVRTAWLAGARGANFVRAVLARAEAGRPFEVVGDQVGSPTFTRDLAAAIVEVLASGRYGTVNRTNTGSCSRFELAKAACGSAGLDVEVRSVPTEPDPQRAPRPAWAVLDATHATAQGLTPLPSWREGLERLLDELGFGRAT